MKVNLWCQKRDQWLFGDGRWKAGGDGREGLQRGMTKLLSVMDVHYFDCGDGVIGVHMSKHSKLYTLSMYSLLYINNNSSFKKPEQKCVKFDKYLLSTGIVLDPRDRTARKRRVQPSSNSHCQGIGKERST